MSGKIVGAKYERGYVYNFHFHLIWCTKDMHELFVGELADEMRGILKKIADLNEITIEKMEVMPDHIHLLISFKPKKAATDVVKAFKGASARLFLADHPEIRRDSFWGNHLWTRSYYMSTLGDMSRDVVEQYIADQKRHSSTE